MKRLVKLTLAGLALNGCAASQPQRAVDYVCGDRLQVEVSAAYLRAHPEVKLRVQQPLDVGVGIGTGYHNGLSLSLGQRFNVRPRSTSVTWPDGTRLECVPDTRS